MYALKQNGSEIARAGKADALLVKVLDREQNPYYTVADFRRDGYQIESLALRQLTDGEKQADAFFDSLKKGKPNG